MDHSLAKPGCFRTTAARVQTGRPIAFGNILEIRDSVSTKYHALVLQANRRLTNGLQFQSSYTLSRAQDNGGSQSSATFTPGFSALFDPFNPSGRQWTVSI